MKIKPIRWPIAIWMDKNHQVVEPDKAYWVRISYRDGRSVLATVDPGPDPATKVNDNHGAGGKFAVGGTGRRALIRAGARGETSATSGKGGEADSGEMAFPLGEDNQVDRPIQQGLLKGLPFEKPQGDLEKQVGPEKYPDQLANYVLGIEQNRQFAKEDIVSSLSEKTGLSPEAVNAGVKQWAVSSNDTTYASLELQRAASEEFGANLSTWQSKKLAGMDEKRAANQTSPDAKLKSVFETNVGILKAAVHSPGKTSGDLSRQFLRGMYEHTQEQFAKAGITHVTLYRGFQAQGDMRKVPAKGEAEFKGNAIESWSLEPLTAARFSQFTSDGGRIPLDKQRVVMARIPVSRILSSARTGFGCLDEQEFTVLGSGRGKDRVRVVQAKQIPLRNSKL